MDYIDLVSTHWHRLWQCYKFLCSIFSKATQPFDFIKWNIIWKLGYKVKYISQISRTLIMFFTNSRIKLFKISSLDCAQYRKNQYKEKEHNQHSSVFKVLRWWHSRFTGQHGKGEAIFFSFSVPLPPASQTLTH